MRCPNPSPNQIWGASLLELLLTLTLTALLISGLMAIYFHDRRARVAQAAIDTLQAHAEFVNYILDTALRQAGNSSCIDPASDTINPEDYLDIYHGQLPAVWHAKNKKGTDSVAVGECRYFQGRWQFVRLAFFIAATTRRTTTGQKIFALYQKYWAHPREELVPDVTDLRIAKPQYQHGVGIITTLQAGALQRDWPLYICLPAYGTC